MIPSYRVRWLSVAWMVGMVSALGVVREVDAQDRLRGIDVSHHQGDVDWMKVKGSGVSFAFACDPDDFNGDETRIKRLTLP